MTKFIDILLEYSFDVSSENTYYPFKRTSNTNYYFKSDENEYEVRFQKYYSTSKDYERSYNRKGRPTAERTNEGKAYKVNATVMAITLDFMKQNSDWETIIIRPINTKRANIVKQFIYKNVPSSDYNVEEITEDGTEIRISKKEKIQ